MVGGDQFTSRTPALSGDHIGKRAAEPHSLHRPPYSTSSATIDAAPSCHYCTLTTPIMFG
jgi:hypothetical protein